MAKNNDLEQKRSQNLLDKWELLFKREPKLKERYESYINEYIELMGKYEELLE